MASLKNKMINLTNQVISKRRTDGSLKAFIYFFNKLKQKFFGIVGYPVALIVALAIIVVRPVYKITFIRLISSRIGHYSVNTELLLCALDAQIETKKAKLFFFTEPNAPVCNVQLHRMWKRVITIVPFPIIAYQVNQILCCLIKSYKNDPLKITFEQASGNQDKTGQLRNTPPHLSFTPKEDNLGNKLLEQLGIPVGAPFVCLLVRDSHYLKTQYPGCDWSYHDYRDANVLSYQKAARYLADKGYYVLRMGKYVNKPFELGNKNIIDYANHPLRCDFLDIYLASHCQFFISTSAGLDGVAQIFRKPVLFTNVAPVYGELQTWHPCVLFLPKKIRCLQTNKLLTFKEIHRIFFIQTNGTRDIISTLKQYNLEMVENSEDEILDIVIEMEKKLNNTEKASQDESLQQQFWQTFMPYTKGNISLPEQVTNIDIRVGTDFLKKYTSLMD